MASAISAAILAGGRARRLGGADKALLRIGASPLERIVDRQLIALRDVTDDIRIVANDASRYSDLQVRVIGDAIAGAGPLGGLHAALLDAHHDAVVILACDLPFVTARALGQLAGAYAEDWDAVVPRSGRGREPLCAVYARRCAAVIRERIEAGELKMEALLEVLRVREIAPGAFVEGDRLFDNVNTPHDYARARESVELDAKPFEDRITE